MLRAGGRDGASPGAVFQLQTLQGVVLEPGSHSNTTSVPARPAGPRDSRSPPPIRTLTLPTRHSAHEAEEEPGRRGASPFPLLQAVESSGPKPDWLCLWFFNKVVHGGEVGNRNGTRCGVLSFVSRH